MTSEEAVLQYFGLRANPFEPKVGVDGKPIEPGLVTRTLDPLVDERLTAYYFDIYDYDQRSAIKVILQNRALNEFPDRRTMRPVLFLVTGTMQSGRGSMVNLCLHAINITHRRPASPVAAAEGLQYENCVFVVASKLSSMNAAANIKQIAEDFASAFYAEDETTADKLTTMVANRPADTAPSTAPYKSLFDAIRARLPKSFQRPVALVLTGFDSFDFWPAVYDATGALFDYIIVDTTRDNDAETSLNQMHDSQPKKNASLVSAKQLDRTKAEAFLDLRLNTEGVTGLLNKRKLIAPDGLDPLFERGRGARPGQTIGQPIGWINATLRRAFNTKFAMLREIVERDGAGRLQLLREHEVQLTRTDISNAREDLNQGRS